MSPAAARIPAVGRFVYVVITAPKPQRIERRVEEIAARLPDEDVEDERARTEPARLG